VAVPLTLVESDKPSTDVPAPKPKEIYLERVWERTFLSRGRELREPKRRIRTGREIKIFESLIDYKNIL
jgi:hypothetical protein